MSLGQLKLVADDVSKFAVANALPFSSIGPDVVRGRIRVAGPDPDALRAALEAEFPGVIVYEPGELFGEKACTTRDNCGPPFISGLTLTRSGASCSAGLVITGTSKGRIITTAGHCGSPGQIWWHHTSSNRVGTYYVDWESGGKADVGLIDAADGSLTDNYYLYYAIVRDIDSYQQYGLDHPNDTVCVTGISDQKCGFLYLRGQTVQKTNGTYLYDQYIVDHAIGGGTSGAFAYRGNPATALGAFWGGTSTQSVYSHQANIVALSGGHVLTSP